MEHLSDRIAFKRTDDDLTVYIRATSPKDKKKIRLLQIWLLLWFTAGIIIISQLFFPGYSSDEKLFMVIYLFFWAYFAYRIAYAYYFRKYGTEVIYINNNKFMIRRDIHGKAGKPHHFVAKGKNPFRKVDEKPGSINAAFYNSFWVVTGGCIAFGEKKDEYRFGLQLSDEETDKLIRLLNKTINIKSN
ncbi:MAG: hypothetical protein N2167_04650 [Flavobacteriales bacterium]|nr:hypothetical protein [Flavobacteriales bacterium]